MTKEVMKLAIEALNTPRPSDSYPPLWRTYENTINTAIKALEEALKQEQLPKLDDEVLLQYPKEDVEWQKQQMEYAQQLKVKPINKEQDKPVAIIEVKNGKAWLRYEIFTGLANGLHNLYTTQQIKEWVGLTGEEIWGAFMESPVELDCSADELYVISRIIEAKLKEKNET